MRPRPAPPHPERDFLLLWTGAGVAFLGLRVAAIAYPMLALWQSGSARAAGLVGFAALLPNLVAQLPAGVIVDRCDRRLLMVGCDVGCVLATASVAVMLAADLYWLPFLAGVAFVQGTLCVAYQLAERSAVRNVVSQERLPAALSSNEARSRGAALLGQPVGAGLLALARELPFIFVAAAHLLSLLLLLAIKKDLQLGRDQPRERFGVSMRAGAAWVIRQPFLRAAVLLIAVSNVIFQMLTLALMVMFVQGGRPVAMVGVITALSGLGGVAGAMSGHWWMRRLRLRTLVIGGFAVWTLVIVPVALTTSSPALALLYTAGGYVGGLLNVAGAVYTLRITPDELLGRVNSVVTLIALGPAALGSLAAGVLLDAVGTAPAVLGMGVAMAALTVIAALTPAVRAMTETE